MSPLSAIPGLCPLCGGTQLDPTPAGVPRGTCHCEVRVQVISYVAATSHGSRNAEAYRVGPGLAVGRTLLWVNEEHVPSDEWRLVHLPSGFAFGYFPACHEAVACARALLKVGDGATGHAVDWTKPRAELVAIPGLRYVCEEQILLHGGLLK